MESVSDITALVINYRTPDLLLKCLESFLACYPESRILLVDNGSGDSSVEIIQDYASRFPKIDVILNRENCYHGPALDQGIHKIRTPYVFTLDSDCEIIRAGFLELMLALFADPELYAAGELMYMNRFGYKMPSPRRKVIRYIHPSAMLLDRNKYLQLRKFTHHGSPCLVNMKSAARAGYRLANFPVGEYIHHAGRGTAAHYGYGLGLRHVIEYFLNKIIDRGV